MILLQILAIIFAISGAILNVLKNRICFVIWTFANVCVAILYIQKGLYLLILNVLLFTGINIIGWFKWRKK